MLRVDDDDTQKIGISRIYQFQLFTCLVHTFGISLAQADGVPGVEQQLSVAADGDRPGAGVDHELRDAVQDLQCNIVARTTLVLAVVQYQAVGICDDILQLAFAKRY